MDLSRTKIHEYAFKFIYEYLFYLKHKKITKIKSTNDMIEDVTEESFDNCDDFFKVIVFETIKDKDSLIEIIQENLKKTWSFSRLNLVDQAILLLFSSEILNRRVEVQIAINEAVELAKKYCEDKSYKYINAVLDNIGKNYEF